MAAVQDAYSRRIVGWQMAEHMEASLVVDALQMAISQRRPEPGLIHHSDQGSQYVSLAFGQAARGAGFVTLKKELVHRNSWPTRTELVSAVFEYIEGFYNPRRRHSTLGMLSPAQFEETTTTTTANDQT